MRGVVQRVSYGKVSVKTTEPLLEQDGLNNAAQERVVGEIGKGYVILLGVGIDDTQADSMYLAEKIANLRIFADAMDKLNLSILDVAGQVLVISQFTLYGDCRKGRRPGFSASAKAEAANRLYEHFVAQLKALGLKVETGVFQADMLVEIHNDGPVTLLIDSKKEF